jgi:hypothetical protein
MTSSLNEIEEFFVLRLVDAIAVIVVGKRSRPYLLCIGSQAGNSDLREVCIPLGELGLEISKNSQ